MAFNMTRDTSYIYNPTKLNQRKEVTEMKKETARQKSVAEIIHLFLHVNRLHRIMAEEQISKLGIHCSQHQMLLLIATNKNICQKDIAQKLEISSAAVAVTLNKLESAELITRSQSFDDARMNHIAITEKGSKLLKTTREMFADIDEQFFKDITDEEMETLKDLLARMAESVKSRG